MLGPSPHQHKGAENVIALESTKVFLDAQHSPTTKLPTVYEVGCQVRLGFTVVAVVLE